MSFRDQASFSMVATREKQHADHLAVAEHLHLGLLPVAAIYGGNASGKTNFFQALLFLKNLVVDGTKPGARILVQPFVLDNDVAVSTRFSITLLAADNQAYELTIEVTETQILEESLSLLSKSGAEILYHRVLGGELKRHKSLVKDEHLKYIALGTRENQLFLTNSISQNVSLFEPVYKWFQESLILIAPDSKFAHFEHYIDPEKPLGVAVSEMLSKLDTGICRIGSVATPLESVPISEFTKQSLADKIQPGETLLASAGQTRFLIEQQQGKLQAKRLVTYHQASSGSELQFEMKQESDGSQRLIELLPAFLDLGQPNSRSVYVIDELDRSLHANLLERLIELYLRTCGVEKRTQLLFTTHNLSLLTQDLFRRDELWLTERNDKGCSSLFSFSEFKELRHDKDIRRDYQLGRFGGVPYLHLHDIPAGFNDRV